MEEITHPLNAPIQYVKGVGPKLAKTFAKKGISTFEDAIYFFPRTYEDRRRITPIAQVRPGLDVTIFGKIISADTQRLGKQLRFEAVIQDATGSMQLFWFRSYPSLKEEFAPGGWFLAHGKVDFFRGVAKITHPDYEKVKDFSGGKPPSSYNFGRVVPVYSESEGLNQKLLRRVMAEVLKTTLTHLEDPLPEDLRARLKLPTLRESVIALHFPSDFPKEGAVSPAVSRIIFEEFFVLQLGLAIKKKRLQESKAPVFSDLGGVLEKFIKALPFRPTEDQAKAIEDIRRDCASGRTMTRLVQGDVGAGKTIVGFAGAALAAAEGFQTAFMAPTEILAQQHFNAAERFLAPLGIKPLLLVSSNSQKKEVRDLVRNGSAQVVIGTHALFQEAIDFKRLGLVIVDEQHRFGVEQRSELVRKGLKIVPHLLLMTATPIPRTLALTLYGDLDVTLISQKPAGRKPIRTSILRDRERPKLYQKIRATIERGEQVYIIYPLVEASEKLELKSATEMYEKLQREVFPDFRLALLHGRMKGEEKDEILKAFKEKQFQLLVSTTVIEVGIDVANATLMVIEHPERLGLSQLHQLRGRVGRGELESECLLIADQFITERLRVMTRTEDGFEIAEEDLKIRGPGEFLGTRQSGMPGFRVGDILRDAHLLSLARFEALQLLAVDPELTSQRNRGVRKMVETAWKEKIERLRGG